MNNFWTLVRFELKKILSRKITWIAFGIVFVIMLAFGFYRAVASHEVNGVRITAHEEEMQAKAEEKKLAGRLVNDELLEDMFTAMATDEAAFQPYRTLYNELVRDLCGSNTLALSRGSVGGAKEALGLSQEEEFVYAARRQQIERKLESQYLTDGEKEYWRNVLDNEKSVPWEYDYYHGVDFA